VNKPEYSLASTEAFEDFPYQFTYPPAPPPSLVTSIGKVGILSPILTIRNGDQIQILDGHRRLMAARHTKITRVPIAIISPISPLKTLMTWIYAQSASRSLNPFEIARVVENGPEVFKINSDEIFNLIIAESLISLPKQLLPDLPGILSLPERLKREAVLRSYSASFLVKLSKLYPQTLLETMSSLLDVFSLSENQLSQLIEWIDEITRRDKLKPSDIFVQDPLSFLLSHPRMPTAKKRDAILKAIYEKRFPEKARLDKAFKEIQQKFSSIGNLNFLPPGEFAGDRFELRIVFSNPEDIKTSLQKAIRLQNEIKSLFKLF